ncbi:unnamed protein product [Amoebophrya sp. A120]|nr:unnamed protein product [Amoebophrya sp. A120]|eukprot:GSA120T00002998001.1
MMKGALRALCLSGHALLPRARAAFRSVSEPDATKSSGAEYSDEPSLGDEESQIFLQEPIAALVGANGDVQGELPDWGASSFAEQVQYVPRPSGPHDIHSEPHQPQEQEDCHHAEVPVLKLRFAYFSPFAGTEYIKLEDETNTTLASLSETVHKELTGFDHTKQKVHSLIRVTIALQAFDRAEETFLQSPPPVVAQLRRKSLGTHLAPVGADDPDEQLLEEEMKQWLSGLCRYAKHFHRAKLVMSHHYATVRTHPASVAQLSPEEYTGWQMFLDRLEKVGLYPAWFNQLHLLPPNFPPSTGALALPTTAEDASGFPVVYFDPHKKLGGRRAFDGLCQEPFMDRTTRTWQCKRHMIKMRDAVGRCCQFTQMYPTEDGIMIREPRYKLNIKFDYQLDNWAQTKMHLVDVSYNPWSDTESVNEYKDVTQLEKHILRAMKTHENPKNYPEVQQLLELQTWHTAHYGLADAVVDPTTEIDFAGEPQPDEASLADLIVRIECYNDIVYGMEDSDGAFGNNIYDRHNKKGQEERRMYGVHHSNCVAKKHGSDTLYMIDSNFVPPMQAASPSDGLPRSMAAGTTKYSWAERRNSFVTRRNQDMGVAGGYEISKLLFVWQAVGGKERKAMKDECSWVFGRIYDKGEARRWTHENPAEAPEVGDIEYAFDTFPLDEMYKSRAEGGRGVSPGDLTGATPNQVAFAANFAGTSRGNYLSLMGDFISCNSTSRGVSEKKAKDVWIRMLQLTPIDEEHLAEPSMTTQQVLDSYALLKKEELEDGFYNQNRHRSQVENVALFNPVSYNPKWTCTSFVVGYMAGFLALAEEEKNHGVMPSVMDPTMLQLVYRELWSYEANWIGDDGTLLIGSQDGLFRKSNLLEPDPSLIGIGLERPGNPLVVAGLTVGNHENELRTSPTELSKVLRHSRHLVVPIRPPPPLPEPEPEDIYSSYPYHYYHYESEEDHTTDDHGAGETHTTHDHHEDVGTHSMPIYNPADAEHHANSYTPAYHYPPLPEYAESHPVSPPAAPLPPAHHGHSTPHSHGHHPAHGHHHYGHHGHGYSTPYSYGHDPAHGHHHHHHGHHQHGYSTSHETPAPHYSHSAPAQYPASTPPYTESYSPPVHHGPSAPHSYGYHPEHVEVHAPPHNSYPEHIEPLPVSPAAPVTSAHPAEATAAPPSQDGSTLSTAAPDQTTTSHPSATDGHGAADHNPLAPFVPMMQQSLRGIGQMFQRAGGQQGPHSSSFLEGDFFAGFRNAIQEHVGPEVDWEEAAEKLPAMLPGLQRRTTTAMQYWNERTQDYVGGEADVVEHRFELYWGAAGDEWRRSVGFLQDVAHLDLNQDAGYVPKEFHPGVGEDQAKLRSGVNKHTKKRVMEWRNFPEEVVDLVIEAHEKTAEQQAMIRNAGGR